MRKIKFRFAALAVSAALAACVTTTAYAPQARPGEAGYSERRVDDTHWRVEFVGDETASAAIVERNLLFRSAELTQESGYAWFKPSDHEAQSDIEVIVEAPRYAARAGVTAPWRPAWRRRGMLRWSDWMTRGPEPLEERRTPEPHIWSFERYSARETIEMGTGETPNNAFNASAVAQLLRGEVEPD